MAKIKLGLLKTTLAQEALRIEIEKSKKERNFIARQEKEFKL